jgi:pimeloyl-ACP methyl ester carboxylesterase
MKKVWLLIILLVVSASTVTGQKSLKEIEGSWTGVMETIAGNLQLVFNFTMTEADTIKATLDSPDQSAMGIPMGRVIFEGDTLVADAPMIRGQFRGVCEGDSILTGNWIQLGRSYELTVRKNAVPITYNRPQEPRPPYPYTEEEVTFRNSVEDFDLAGTLTLPAGEGPFPAVVLITGSGPEDRDETIFMHKPFKVIADYLTRNGIAVLRYDDRGVGKSKGSMAEATSLTLAGDAEAAVDYLMHRPEIDSRKIGLAGHSEGGLIAPIVASRNKNIAFIVSLAGPGVTGRDIMLKQARDIMEVSGTDEKQIEESLNINRHLFQMAVDEPDTRRFAKAALDWYGSELDKQGLDPAERKDKMSAFAEGIVSVNNPWMRYFIATDPAQFWSKVKCPVLALNGEKDLQVNYEQNLPAIKAALKKGGNRKVKIVALPGLNHLFQHAETGLPAEYIKIEETFSPEVLALMTSWIRRTVKRDDW